MSVSPVCSPVPGTFTQYLSDSRKDSSTAQCCGRFRSNVFVFSYDWFVMLICVEVSVPNIRQNLGRKITLFHSTFIVCGMPGFIVAGRI